MNVHSKVLFSIAIIIVLYMMISFYRSTGSSSTRIVSSISPTVNQNYTCQAWKINLLIDMPKYQTCLTWRRNDAFWSVESIRHTAFKHLLNSSSLIVEVGGNTGHDTGRFVELYNCSIISFEPLHEMSKALTAKFQSNRKVEIRPYGLGNQARKVAIEPFDKNNMGTSIFRKLTASNSTKVQSIELQEVVQIIQSIRTSKTSNGLIDMISINCEGCEFEILPALIANNLTQYIRIIQFASHMEFLANSSCIYCQIEQALDRTHRIIYQYTMLWEAWVLKTKTGS